MGPGEGAECDRLYVVTQGSVRAAVTDPDGGERELAVHEKGGYFNELALVTDWDGGGSGIYSGKGGGAGGGGGGGRGRGRGGGFHTVSKRCEATVQVRSRRAVCLSLRWDRLRQVAGYPGIKLAFSAAHTTRLRAAAEGNITARATLGNMTNRSYRSNATSAYSDDPPEDLEPPSPLPWDPYAAPLGEPGGPKPTQLAPKGSHRKAQLSAALLRSLVFEGESERAVAKAVAEMREVFLRPGEMLAEEGQSCWGMCVVESGTLHLYHYDSSTEELADDPGPETALHLAEVGEGYVSGEICTLFNTVHDATMIAGERGCRLWGLSLFHYQRAAGLRDERGRRRQGTQPDRGSIRFTI